VAVVTFLFAFTISAVILGKRGKRQKYDNVPHILRKMNQRLTTLAYKASEQLTAKQMEPFAHDFFALTSVTESQVKMMGKSKPIGKEAERQLVKHLRKVMKPNASEFLSKLEALSEKHDIALTRLAKSDFRYRFLSQELSNLRPLPITKVDELTDRYIVHSFGLNTVLMLQQAYREEIDKMLSIDMALTSKSYPRYLEHEMNRLAASIANSIAEYAKGNDQEGERKDEP